MQNSKFRVKVRDPVKSAAATFYRQVAQNSTLAASTSIAQHTACNRYKWIDYRYDNVEYKSVANQHIKAPVKSKNPKVYKDVGQTRQSKAQENSTYPYKPVTGTSGLSTGMTLLSTRV